MTSSRVPPFHDPLALQPRRWLLGICRSALFVAGVAGLIAVALPAAPIAKAPTVYLIGGSTMASYPESRPIVGWGQALVKSFRAPAKVDNRAKSGRSTKSFIDQGLWTKVIDDMVAGDFLIISFGANDSKEFDPARYAAPRGAFQTNLERFIREARAKGATPVLTTPVTRRVWDSAGKFVEQPSEYAIVAREVAAREQVPLLEMRDATIKLERSLGVEGSIALHLYVPAGKYDSYPKGAKDDTHYSAYGATRVAELAVQEIRRTTPALAAWLVDDAGAAAPARRARLPIAP